MSIWVGYPILIGGGGAAIVAAITYTIRAIRREAHAEREMRLLRWWLHQAQLDMLKTSERREHALMDFIGRNPDGTPKDSSIC